MKCREPSVSCVSSSCPKSEELHGEPAPEQESMIGNHCKSQPKRRTIPMTAKRTVFLNPCLAVAVLMVVTVAPAFAKPIPCELCSCSRSCSYPCEEIDEGPSTCGDSGNLCIDSPACEPCYCSVTIGGGPGNDTLNGTSNNDCIFGYGGHDTIYGNAGDDCLYGGSGTDYVDGGPGYDFCEGEIVVNCENE